MATTPDTYTQPHSPLVNLYQADEIDEQRARYTELAANLDARAPGSTLPIFVSAPGRTELAGNHTDHNHGKVLAASVMHDMVAAVRPRDDNRIVLTSQGFDGEFTIDLSSLKPVEAEHFSTQALIRGVADGFQRHGFTFGGFDAYVNSRVPVGSGLSSSAGFEVLVGGIFNHLYNENRISTVELAKIGQYAENTHFSKPCGLMDQLAVAVGGVLYIDFAETNAPEIQRISSVVSNDEFALVVVDTGGSHADLSHEYASIPEEMKTAASLFGSDVLGGLDPLKVWLRIGELRRTHGDRAVLRTLHFFTENERVEAMRDALLSGNLDRFRELVQQSGWSSSQCLQNIVPSTGGGHDQPVALALGASQAFFPKRGRGVCRVHGGGFAGTIQAFVHRDDLLDYVSWMEQFLTNGCVHELHIRPVGISSVELDC
jgi:galactokinase